MTDDRNDDVADDAVSDDAVSDDAVSDDAVADDPTPAPPPRLRSDAPRPSGSEGASSGVTTAATRSGPPGTTGRPSPRSHPRPDARPAAPAARVETRPVGRAVPVRLVLLAGLAVLLLLAVPQPDGVAAVVGLPLALTLPGAVLQPRFLPGLATDLATRWCLRVAVSLGTWALVGLAVGAAGIAVRSVWPVVVAVVLLAAVVVGEPEGERRFGWLPVRAWWWAAAGLAVVVGLAFGGRALVAVAGGTAGPTGPGGVTVAFADPTTPFALTATGARATARVVVTNPGDDDVLVELAGAVGRGLPWTEVEVAVPAGATRTVEVTGTVPVCSDPQQALVTVTGAGDVAPLATVLPGTDGAPRCGAV